MPDTAFPPYTRLDVLREMRRVATTVPPDSLNMAAWFKDTVDDAESPVRIRIEVPGVGPVCGTQACLGGNMACDPWFIERGLRLFPHVVFNEGGDGRTTGYMPGCERVRVGKHDPDAELARFCGLGRSLKEDAEFAKELFSPDCYEILDGPGAVEEVVAKIDRFIAMLETTEGTQPC